MSKRGTRSHTSIAGYTLTWAELTVLNQLQDYLEKNGAGRSVPLMEIFPGADHRGKRHAARRLEALGVLQACEIEFCGEMLKGKNNNDTITAF